MRYCPPTKRKNRSPFGRSMSSINLPTSIQFVRPGRTPMSLMHDGRDDPPVRFQSASTGADAARETRESTGQATRVLVVDADSALFGLIGEWLAPHGYSVMLERAGDGSARGRVDLVV